MLRFVSALLLLAMTGVSARADDAPKPQPQPKKAQPNKPEPKKPQPKAAQPEKKRDPKFTITDPAVAAEDVDFQLQGEYFGRLPGGYEGLQVVARGDGAFEAVHYKGGLPGGGWNRVDRTALRGQREGDSLTLEGEGLKVTVAGGRATLAKPDGTSLGSIARIRRVSTRQGRPAPAGAKVLFDGSHADAFKNGTMTEDGLLQMGTEFVSTYRDFDLHIEFRLPYMPYALGQQRSNSGVYLQSRYEVQVLDSFGLEGVKNECGALYRQRAPDVNMCFPPLRWQTYDISFTAPRFDEAGKKTQNARITVLHNGVAIHDDVEVVAKTGAGRPEGPNPLPTKLQNHGNPVVFRNIWVLDRAPAAELQAGS